MKSLRAFQDILKEIYEIIKELKGLLKEVYQSRSWRITQPLRWGTHQISILRERGIKSRIKAILKRLFNPVLRIVDDFLISQLLKREGAMKKPIFRGILTHIRKLLRFLMGTSHDHASPPPEQITDRTNQIYSDLVSAKKLNNSRKD